MFHWLKGLGSKPDTIEKKSVEEKQPRGLSTIDLDPFASSGRVSPDADDSTIVMPELQDDGATEVWQALDELRSEPPLPLNEIPAATASHSDRIPFDLHLIPSLRTMANSLRLAAESAEGDSVSQRWRAYLQLVPSDSGAWLSLGEHYLEKGELSDAKKVFKKAVEREPNDGITKGALGHTLLMLGEISEARRCLEEACAEMPDEIGLHETLLACLEAVGDVDAIQQQLSFIEDMKRGR